MRVVALIAARNEERFIGKCIRHLVRHGVGVYLIDNGSTDRTVPIAQEFSGRGLVGIDHAPFDGTFHWLDILRKKEQLASTVDADWFMHVDPDEFRLPPVGRRTINEALCVSDARGFNAVNFQEFAFFPTLESPDHDHPDFQRTMRWYYPVREGPLFQVKAWKRQPGPVDLVSSGGHQAVFHGRNVDPDPFRFRHYPVLSVEHAVRKYVDRRFDAEEVRRGGHTWRPRATRETFQFLPEAEMLAYRSDDELDASSPRGWYHFESKLKVMIYPTGHDGCAYVRARWPGQWLEAMGLCAARISDAWNAADVEWADAVVFQRTRGTPDALKWWGRCSGKRRIYDTDDDVFIHPRIRTTAYYTDLELDGMRRMISEADLVTCSTPGVAAAMSEYTKRTVVVPNGIPPTFFERACPRIRGQVRIGFLAAPSHDRDFRIAKHAVMSAMRDFPGVRLVFIGHVPSSAGDLLPSRQVIHQPWVNYVDLHNTLRKLGIDVLLVPWEDTPFNRGKSAGKWLDATYMGAATIATPMSDFARFCRHRETAILVGDKEGWVDALRELVADADLRTRLVANARKDILERFAMDVLAKEWAAAYAGIR